MKRKRVFAFVITLVLAAGLMLASCSGGDSGGGGATNEPASSGGSSSNSGGGAPATSDQKYDITVELNYPEPAANVLTQYFNDLTELSDGRLNFDIYYGLSLSGQEGLLDALMSGVVQAAGFMPYNYDTMFPYSGALFNMPFLGFADMEVASKVWREMYATTDVMQAEYERAGLTVVAAMGNPIYNMYFKDQDVDVRVPADLKGMTLIANVPEIQQMLVDNGAAPVECPPPDYYTNLEKGVCDGIIQHINILTSFGVNPELCGTSILFEQGGGGFVTSILNVVWKTDFLNSLPQDLQDIIMERSVSLGDEMLANDAGLVAENTKISADSGATMIYLTEAEVQAWKDAAVAIKEASLQRYVDEGATDMFNVYDKLQETITKY